MLKNIENQIEAGNAKLSEQAIEQAGNEGTLNAQNFLIRTNDEELEEDKVAHEKQVKEFKNEIEKYQSQKTAVVAGYEEVKKKSDEAIALAGKAEEVYDMYAGMTNLFSRRTRAR